MGWYTCSTTRQYFDNLQKTCPQAKNNNQAAKIKYLDYSHIIQGYAEQTCEYYCKWYLGYWGASQNNPNL